MVVVGPDGRFQREIGRGGAPGEFQAPANIAVFPGGDLVVVDVVQDRISRFGPGGELIAEVAARLWNGIPGSIHPRPSGAVIGDARVYFVDGQLRVRAATGFQDVDHRPVQRYAIEGDGAAELLHRARVARRPMDPQRATDLTAFFPQFHMTVLPDGRTVASDTSAYLLTVLAPAGAAERILHRPLADRPVTAASREREKQRLLDDLVAGRAPESVVSFGSQPPSPAGLQARHRRIEEMRFPAVFTHVRNLASDTEGRIWVERTGADPHGPGPIDLLTADGRYLGTLPASEPGLPAALGPGGRAAYVTLDELDVPTIRVVRLRLVLPD